MRALCLIAMMATSASAQNLVFTTRVHVACPVQMSAIAQTKDLGFQSVVFHNDTRKPIDTVHLSVSLWLESGEEINVDIEKGKTLIIRFLTVGDPNAEGSRLVFFELNGTPREVVVQDRSLAAKVQRRPKAEPGNPLHVAAPMPGLVASVLVSAGKEVAPGQKLLTLEAMKMETTVYAERAGTVAEVLVGPATQVEAGDLLLKYEK